jgi:hypothetical protein
LYFLYERKEVTHETNHCDHLDNRPPGPPADVAREREAEVQAVYPNADAHANQLPHANADDLFRARM